jgi:hypothetical protein
MEIIDYTEKSLVIKGEKTREYKENLKELGGKFNSSLKCGAGWVFPKTKKAELEALIQKADSGSLKAAEPKFYKDKKESNTPSYTVSYSNGPKFENTADLEKFLDNLQKQVDNISIQIKTFRQTLKNKETIEEKKETEEKETVEYEEVVEYEEEAPAEPVKKLLKVNFLK